MYIDLPVIYCNVLNVKIRQYLKKEINGSSHSWQNKTHPSFLNRLDFWTYH